MNTRFRNLLFISLGIIFVASFVFTALSISKSWQEKLIGFGQDNVIRQIAQTVDSNGFANFPVKLNNEKGEIVLNEMVVCEFESKVIDPQ